MRVQHERADGEGVYVMFVQLQCYKNTPPVDGDTRWLTVNTDHITVYRVHERGDIGELKRNATVMAIAGQRVQVVVDCAPAVLDKMLKKA